MIAQALAERAGQNPVAAKVHVAERRRHTFDGASVVQALDL